VILAHSAYPLLEVTRTTESSPIRTTSHAADTTLKKTTDAATTHRLVFGKHEGLAPSSARRETILEQGNDLVEVSIVDVRLFAFIQLESSGEAHALPEIGYADER
jgi:hypothetical protein